MKQSELQIICIILGQYGLVVSALLLFGIWLFTRLVHVWSLPLEYISRKFIVYRSIFGRRPIAMSTNRSKNKMD
ncbi:respiratory nitrate reductase subunit gamma [Bacillus sp. 1P10SD]|uniref:respiratory nitrate reductase subunit gamma n=1 Tax=Bacillus sp. 1P10SD TaxID=3132265 RepID=UPI0039A64B24